MEFWVEEILIKRLCGNKTLLPIDLVVVNLYPFQETVIKPDCTLAMAIENIDIGGPTMLRAAAKNHKYVSVITDAQDYTKIVSDIAGEGISQETRFKLALKAFEHTAEYDGSIANYLSAIKPEDSTKSDEVANPEAFGSVFSMQFKRKQSLRYGENPHQQAAFYSQNIPPTGLYFFCGTNSRKSTFI